MTKKPSFFEKLTGASWSENESVEEEKPAKVKSVKDEPASKKTEPIQKDFSTEKKKRFLLRPKRNQKTG